jgi:chromosome segregation ATPase
MCEKGSGAYFCTGCKAYFCMKDLKNHHAQLLNELDVLVEDRNALHQKLSKDTKPNNSSSPLLAQIDEWQRATMEKVKQAADEARQQVTKILNSERSEITTKFENFSKELIRLKETEDFVHDDLTRLQQMIRQLNQDLKQLAQPPTIVLHTEQTNQVVWNCLIYVEQKSINTEKQTQQQIKGRFIHSLLRQYFENSTFHHT